MPSSLDQLYTTQISLTEWVRQLNPSDATALAEEDNKKRDRLGVLRRFIGLPYDQPTQFEAAQLTAGDPALQQFIAEHGDELCALRLIPKRKELPKLRMRGKTVRAALDWYHEQDLVPADYLADFVPHSEYTDWATIFVVNHKGIFGEIYPGGHHVLTQGFHEEGEVITFAFDFHTWKLDPENPKALNHLQEVVAWLLIEGADSQSRLQKELQATFAHNYLEGYFETTYSAQRGLWFIDYNRILGKQYADFQITASSNPESSSQLRGKMACGGTAQGAVRIVEDPSSQFEEGEVLVCAMTTPNYLPLMRRAAAIVTDQGGVLCHAAIVARELGIPCVVGTKTATSALRPGQLVTVDATTGTIHCN